MYYYRLLNLYCNICVSWVVILHDFRCAISFCERISYPHIFIKASPYMWDTNWNFIFVCFRLFPYFSGKNHIEEIMYFENLRRSQLVTLIEKYKDVLILCTYEDPASWWDVNGSDGVDQSIKDYPLCHRQSYAELALKWRCDMKWILW